MQTGLSRACFAPTIVAATLVAAVVGLLTPAARADDTTAKPPAASQPTSMPVPKNAKSMTPEERDALLRSLRERAEAMAAAKAAGVTPESGMSEEDKRLKRLKAQPQPAKQRAIPAPTTNPADAPSGGPFGPVPPTVPPNPQQKPTSPAPGGGCGAGAAGALSSLTPPPEDQPQPKLAIESERVEVSVWRGTPAVFEYKLKNEGEGALNVQLKGG